MARSRRKCPFIRQERIHKKSFNNRLRTLKLDYCPKGGHYKRLIKNFNTWCYIWTFEDALNSYKNREDLQKMFPTIEEYKDYWERQAVRK